MWMGAAWKQLPTYDGRESISGTGSCLNGPDMLVIVEVPAVAKPYLAPPRAGTLLRSRKGTFN